MYFRRVLYQRYFSCIPTYRMVHNMTCKKCEEQRHKLKEAWSQKDLIKAAMIAMEGAKMIAKGGKDE